MNISYEYNPKIDEAYPHVVRIRWEEYNLLTMEQKHQEVKNWIVPLVGYSQLFYLPGVGWCFKEQRHAELFMLKWA